MAMPHLGRAHGKDKEMRFQCYIAVEMERRSRAEWEEFN